MIMIITIVITIITISKFDYELSLYAYIITSNTVFNNFF